MASAIQYRETEEAGFRIKCYLKMSMDNNIGTSNATGILGTIVSTGLFIFAKLTLSDLAMIATIFAGVSTGVLNILNALKKRKKE